MLVVVTENSAELRLNDDPQEVSHLKVKLEQALDFKGELVVGQNRLHLDGRLERGTWIGIDILLRSHSQKKEGAAITCPWYEWHS